MNANAIRTSSGYGTERTRITMGVRTALTVIFVTSLLFVVGARPGHAQGPASQPTETPEEAQPSEPPASEPAGTPAEAAPDGGSGAEGAKTGAEKDDVKILQISEDGIVFKDESGQIVSIGEEIVVTGAKRQQRSQATLSSISVLTREDVNALDYLYLGDMLAQLPGLDVRWGKMQRYYIGTRGLGGTALNSRMLLLWDGIPINDAFTGELRGGHFLPMVDIDHVEVIRGAGSTLYGANAFNGVVNVITKPLLKGKDWVTANATLGSFLTSRVQAAFRQSIKSFKVKGSAEVYRTDGPFPTVTRPTRDGIAEINKNDDVQRVGLSAAMAFKGLRVGGEYVYGDRGRPGTFTTDSQGRIRPCTECHNADSPYGQGVKYPVTRNSCGSCHLQPRDRETTHRGRVYAIFEHAFGKSVRMRAQAYHSEAQTEYEVTSRTALLEPADMQRPELKQRSSGGEAYASYSYKTLNTALAGAEVRNYQVASHVLLSEEGHTASLFEAGFYIEDEFRPMKWLSVTGGVRFDLSTKFDLAISPRGGVLLTPLERLALRLGVASAIRNPSLSELFVLDERGKYRVLGNPDLGREGLFSIEGGASYILEKPLVIRLAVTGFYNQASDLISFRATGPEEASFFNIDEAEIVGVEAEIDVKLKKMPEINWFFNYSYQWATDADGERLPYAPSSKVNSGLRVKYSRLGAMVRARVVDERNDNMGITLPMFITVDAAASFKMWKGLGLQIWARNLTDEVYQESLGIPGWPRSFFVTLSYAQ